MKPCHTCRWLLASGSIENNHVAATASTPTDVASANSMGMDEPPHCGRRRILLDCLDDVLDHLLGVAEHHHRLVHVEEGIVDSGVAGRHRTLVDEYRACLVRFEDRHPVNRAAFFF